MTVDEPKRAVGAGSKRFFVREPARSVISRKPRHVTQPWSMSRRWSGRQEKASGLQIEARWAIEVLSQHLQPMAGPFAGSLALGQGDGGVNGVGAIATAATPPGEEGRFVWIEETAVAAMPRLALGKRRVLESPARRCAA